MWRGFETAMLEETLIWQDIRASLCTPRAFLGLILTLTGGAMVVHFLI